MDARQVVQEFCDGMVKRDAEALRMYLADDVVYQNTGMEAAVGIDATLESLAFQVSMFPTSYEYKTVNIVADGGLVLTERLDMIAGPDGVAHGVPVMGAFEVTDGKITRWTDYFDTALPAKMLSGEDYSALVPKH